MRVRRHRFVGFVVVAMVLAACGGGDGGDEGDAGTGDAPTVTTPSAEDLAEDPERAAQDLAEDLAEDPEGAAQDLAEDLEETQQAVGGGGATLTVGDQTWTFESVLCAFGEEEIGQEGAVFVLSSLQDGMQFYVSIDSFGHSVSLDDIEDFENPSVSLEARGAGEFIDLDGKNASGTAGFVDGNTDDFAEVEGSFEATCP